MKTLWLNFHVGYACRHSGACCTSGWPIPVERDRVVAIQSLLDRDRARVPVDPWLVPAAGAPDDVAGALALQPNGHCVFFGMPTSGALPSGAPGCAVHPARPSSCSHFPFVCLIDPRGVHVTLSHYCPTAAAMLFDHEGPIAIVAGPPPIAGVEIPEGLDARESLPPLESPHRLMTFEAFADWERREVAREAHAELMAPSVALFDQARHAVPAPWSWPAAPGNLGAQWAALAGPAWPRFLPVVRRYRAAKIFASWAAYQGDGVSAVLRLAGMAVAVLGVEAVRQCVQAGRALDAELLKQAIRQADLLLVHYADGRVLSSGTSI